MSKVVTALLAGIAIGILIAPRKGSETRKKIVDDASNLRDDLSDLINGAAEKIKSGIAAAEDQAKDLFQKGKDEWENLSKGTV
jgi:gas vesicle protein